LLTTHYLEEADQLADQISVIDHGRVIADGTPEQLKSKIGGSRVDIVLNDVDELPVVARLVERVSDGEVEIDGDRRRVSAPVRDRVATLTELLRALEDAGIVAEDVALRKPTLDEVFLELTGHRAEEEVAA
jgi:ABC-2 type transport system ATP-binding protein